MVVGRFAPSPSGRMHLGNVFAALLSWLYARSAGGEFLLRIEDLDPDRCRAEYAEQLRDDLRWLGIDWDGEGQKQSQRSDIYREAFTVLEQKGLLYPCYCTRGELHAASAPHASDGTPIYAGTCRTLTEAERAEKTRTPAWRIRVPDCSYGFEDGLQGYREENLMRECGDFIVRRSDGVYAYQLAVVVDDALMGVTQVVRGRDLLGSTPRQLYLYEQLGYRAPEFIHVPLLLSEDGRRLSKRDRDLDLGALRAERRAEDVIGLLACAAGLTDRPQPISANELLQGFAPSRVRRDDCFFQQNIYSFS
ncbi:MAG: tRNA glutamyl-Q(34) synthetase GluQRS [Oscillospiraceae bacterium]|nr:tRNA glutamyl-Q(34) synthetase GluQRS [Oscillospiraceae bacterium]